MSKKHTHRYHRVTTGAGQIWACSLPDCNHFMPAHYTELLPGKATICWECAEPFVLTKAAMERDKPVCPDCGGLAAIADKIDISIPNSR